MAEWPCESVSGTSPDTSVKGIGENFMTQKMLNNIAIYDLKVNLTEVQISLFADGMTLYIDDLRHLPKTDQS